MSTQILTRSASLSGLRLLVCSLLAGSSLLVAACDPFLVSACRFEDLPGCPRAPSGSADAGSKPPDLSTPPRDEPAPLGPLLRFEWRAKIELGTNRRFVGLQGSPRQAVFLKLDGPNKRWDVATFDLSNSDTAKRVVVAQTCSPSTCPEIPSTMDFISDRIYRTSSGYFYFGYKSSKKVKTLPGWSELTDCNLGTLTVRPFVSAQYDALMLAQANDGDMYVRYEHQNYSPITISSPTASLFVIGDLDAYDHPANDLEAIAFFGAEAFLIKESNLRINLHLPKSLNAAIQKNSDGLSGPIQAAYIYDINNDRLPDFLFVRGGRFRVVSYRGTDRQGFPYEFGDWEQDVIPPILGETVQYIAIDELSQDSYPDLIVETDKNVHFYRNMAM